MFTNRGAALSDPVTVRVTELEVELPAASVTTAEMRAPLLED